MNRHLQRTLDQGFSIPYSKLLEVVGDKETLDQQLEDYEETKKTLLKYQVTQAAKKGRSL